MTANLPPPPKRGSEEAQYRWLYSAWQKILEVTGLTGVTASATEINYNDGATPGVVTANKTIIAGPTKNLDTLTLAASTITDGTIPTLHTTSFYLNGTQVTAKATDINRLKTVMATATIVIGAEAANTINVDIQLMDNDGGQVSGSIDAYFSDNADGSNIIGTAPSGTVAIGTYGSLLDVNSVKKVFKLVSDATGHIDINIGEAGAKTLYLVLEMPLGRRLITQAITFV